MVVPRGYPTPWQLGLALTGKGIDNGWMDGYPIRLSNASVLKLVAEKKSL